MGYKKTTEPYKCPKCNITKCPSEFHSNPCKINGLQTLCIECNREKKKNINYQRNTEPQKCAKCSQIKNASEFNTHTKKMNGLNSYCKICEAKDKREYKYKSVKNFITILHGDAKKRARLKKKFFDTSIETWIDIYNNQQGKCALTGIEMTISSENNIYNISPDRIDSDKGYTKDNIQFVCASVNIAKNDLNTNTFIEMCRQVANFNTPT